MNSRTDFDAAILVGRFQPYHNGHAALLEKTLAMAPLQKIAANRRRPGIRVGGIGVRGSG